MDDFKTTRQVAAELGTQEWQIEAALRGENASIPGGSVDVGLRKYNLKTSGSYETLEEIADTVVTGREGRVVKLRDVATVDWDASEVRYTGRFKGERAVFVTATAKDRVDVFAVRKAIYERADRFALAADGSTLLVRSGKELRAVDATKPPDDKAAPADLKPSRKSGWIDLDRVRVSVDPRAEWRQMLREVWRLQRDQFWVPDMSGIDWEAVYRHYEPLLERVATRAELSDLIWEMQGELGTSHAYEMGGDYRRPPQVPSAPGLTEMP
jgi:hypothetical protein